MNGPKWYQRHANAAAADDLVHDLEAAYQLAGRHLITEVCDILAHTDERARTCQASIPVRTFARRLYVTVEDVRGMVEIVALHKPGNLVVDGDTLHISWPSFRDYWGRAEAQKWTDRVPTGTQHVPTGTQHVPTGTQHVPTGTPREREREREREGGREKAPGAPHQSDDEQLAKEISDRSSPVSITEWEARYYAPDTTPEGSLLDLVKLHFGPTDDPFTRRAIADILRARTATIEEIADAIRRMVEPADDPRYQPARTHRNLQARLWDAIIRGRENSPKEKPFLRPDVKRCRCGVPISQGEIDASGHIPGGPLCTDCLRSEGL